MKPGQWFAASALLGVLFTAPASAEVFTGYTTGCFGAGCIPEVAYSPALDVLGGLTYANSTFNVADAGGFAGLGATGSLFPLLNVDNLGSFALGGQPFTYAGNQFNLRVTFTGPPGTTPSAPVYTAALTGTVTSNDAGGAFIDFNNTLQHFAFNGGSF